jgi:hypothetical protein
MSNEAKFNSTQREAILALLENIGGDGHSVYDPKILAEFPKAIQDRFTHEIESDESDWKSTLRDHDGNVIKSIVAVYSLSVHEGIASDLGLTGYRQFNGRGFRAQAACKMIRDFFGEGKEG